MVRRIVISLVLVLACVRVGNSQVRSGPLVAVHLEPRAAKGFCTTAKPSGVWCDQSGGGTIVSSGELLTMYDGYHVVVDVDPSRGLQEIAFGVVFEKELGNFGWISCADLEMPGGGWPQSGGGNRLVFNDCQNELAEGDPENHSTVILGTMYLYAYGNSQYLITNRSYHSEGGIPYLDCNGQESELQVVLHATTAGFGLDQGRGCRPSQSPVLHETWSGLKRLSSGPN